MKAAITAVLALAIGPATAPAQTVKIATWNLNWLTERRAGDPALPADVHPRRAADFARLRGYAAHLDGDIVAFEEVDGLGAAARVFDPAIYSLVTINENVVQQVGLAVRHGIGIARQPDVATLDVEPANAFRLRYGLDAMLTLPGGAKLRVLVVHLKTGCHTDDLAQSHRVQCTLLAQQIPPLAAWVQARAAEPLPFAVLGDFNRVFDEKEAVGVALARAAPLLRVTQGASDPCWGGGQFIDHIFLGGAARGWLVPDSLRVMTYHTDNPADRARLSDHCPLSVRLNPSAR